MRVAYASPLPPATSGIADYSATLLPALRRAGLEPTPFREPEPGSNSAEAASVRELPRRAGAYDLALYQIGNSAPHHRSIYRTALELPGIAVLHEFLLHHLVKALTLDEGDAAAYVEEMRYCAGETGERAARRLLDTHRPLDVWSFPLFERLVDRSLAVVVHSEFARRRIAASRAGARIAVVPFPVDLVRRPLPEPDRVAAARQRLGIEAGATVLGSFGFVTPHKHLEPALAAFADLRREQPSARFLICGEVSPHYDLGARLRELGADGVTVTGRLERAAFDDAMAACDVAVNLRHPTAGETSASLLDLLALGKPTIVSDLGAFAEIPEGVVARVAVDEHETRHLLALFRALVAREELRLDLGATARSYVEREHAVERTAAAYAKVIGEVARRPATVEEPRPPLGRPLGFEPRCRLAASIGQDAADLGLDELDGEGVLASVADDLAELGWAPAVASR